MKNPTEGDKNQDKWAWQTEISLLWALDHRPNIVKMIGFTEKPYSFVTKCLTATLKDVLFVSRQPEITPQLALQFAIDIASGLAALHQINVIHHSIRPGEIYIIYCFSLSLLTLPFFCLIIPFRCDN